MNNIDKRCTHCGKSKKIAKDFYVNRDHIKGNLVDNWCKACVKAYVVDEQTLRIYCTENLRLFSDDLWKLANVQAQKIVDSHALTSTKEKKEMLVSSTINSYLKQQSQPQYYRFYYKNKEDEKKEDLNNIKIYSSKWHGNYTNKQIEYLDNYYKTLDRDFNLKTESYKDYARKVAKASLAMDDAYSEVLDGVSSAPSKYKNCKEIFDSLSQSAKFAEKTRSENDAVGFGSLGEIVKRLESTGFLQTKVVFPKDDVDKITDDFRWTLSSIGEEF